MANVKCFRCNQGFNSNDLDDIAGDGKCDSCKEISKKIALQVDIEIAEKRKVNPLPQPFYKKIIEEGGPIKARDLGITFGN